MPFQSVPECAEAVINFTTSGKSQVNVLNFWKPGGYNQVDINDLAVAVDGVVGSDYLPILAAGTNYDFTLVRGLTSIVDLTATSALNAGPGTNPGTVELPSNVTLCITLRTGFTGRSARGRFYTVGPTQNDMAAQNLFKSAYGNAAVTMLENIQIAVGAYSWQLVIVSRFSGGARRAVGIKTPVNDIAYRNLDSDSQRGRLPKDH